MKVKTDEPSKSALRIAIDFLGKYYYLVGFFGGIFYGTWHFLIIPQVKDLVVTVASSGYHPTEAEMQLLIDDRINPLWGALDIRVPSKRR